MLHYYYTTLGAFSQEDGLQKGDYPTKKCVLAGQRKIRIMKNTGRQKALNNLMEVQEMALKNLAEWNEEKVVSSCGSACGASDEKKEEKPSAACGSACGAGDEKKEEKPAACGSACGAGDK